MSVLALHTEIMAYGVKTLTSLAEQLDCEVTVVRQDKDRKRGYVPMDSERLKFLPRSEQSASSLAELYNKLQPSLMYVSGWSDQEYLSVCKLARASGIPTITGLDNQWQGNLRQRVACLASRFRVLPYFSHVQVAGVRQYEFARRLGFSEQQILFDYYSCDMDLFAKPAREPQHKPRRQFLFVGRFAPVKGLQELYEAWKAITAGGDPGWDLQIIGSGDDIPDFEGLPHTILPGYLAPEDLAQQIELSDVFVLPSRREPWGVVVHEFAAGGLPLVLSRACGAGTAFLIEKYNGRWFDTGDAASLGRALRWMMEQSPEKLCQMGNRSQMLAARINPEIAAANLASVIA